MTLDDIDIKLEIGSILINVLWLRTAGFNQYTHVKTHCHSGYELHIIPHGYGVLNVYNKSYTIKPGTVYLTGPNIYHEQKTNPENPMEEYCINFEILNSGGSKNIIHKAGNDINSISALLHEAKFWFGNDKYNISELFKKIMEEITDKHIGYFVNIKNYLVQIFINVARCLALNPISTDSLPEKNVNDKRRIIIDEYFNIYDRKITISKLAKAAGLSVRQLNRILLDYYGMSFKKKLVRTKMNKAAALLKSSNESIKSISLEVGIEDPAYFSRVFKKYWGVSPSHFR